ncbi:hypothetical protein, partial [Xanthomonas theicola]
SLTWDRGAEMHKHQRFTLATDVQVFFCFTMTPVPQFAGLRQGSIQQVYQSLRRVQHMPVLSKT